MKTQPKKAPLEKNHFHHDFRNKDKIKRSDHKEYMKWLKHQPLECLECRTLQNVELHHVDPKDSRTVVPLCSYCHRGALFDNREEVFWFDAENNLEYVTRGYYLHRGTRSLQFKEKWSDSILLKIAERLYSEYCSQNHA